MRHHHQAAGKLQQQLLQPLDGVQVEVVGRLVQQQHVGPRHQRLRQRHALARAARQRAHRRVGGQPQALQHLVHPLAPAPAVLRLDARLQCVQIIGTCAPGFDQGAQRRQSLGDRIGHRGVGRQRRLLGDVGHRQIARHLQLAVIHALESPQNAQQGRLAGAVAPDQPHPLFRLEREIRVVQQRQVAERQLSIEQGEQGHERLRMEGSM